MTRIAVLSLLGFVLLSHEVLAQQRAAQPATAPADFKRGLLVQAFLTTPGGTALERRGAAYLSPDLKAVFVAGEMPTYPSRDMGAGVFRVSVDGGGRVTAVKTVRTTSHGMLDNAAIKALRTWRARPGQPRVIDVPVTFHIPGAPSWSGGRTEYPNLAPQPAPGSR